ncbi:MAG: nucleotidyl transferase AbiEii/AbiGii toxin family protein, partial [Elusimicrobia bacterium]|nr:nucleotidyl transferase AbiEii/AbiGii toxin family protein [Elusimicrobiota bacterium]
MLSLDEIREIAVQFQTNEKNVAREYAQHTFLSFLYKEKAADFLLFKGGTALRLIFKSPRFSEDLDF